jgi:hypothetical protein
LALFRRTFTFRTMFLGHVPGKTSSCTRQSSFMYPKNHVCYSYTPGVFDPAAAKVRRNDFAR